MALFFKAPPLQFCLLDLTNKGDYLGVVFVCYTTGCTGHHSRFHIRLHDPAAELKICCCTVHGQSICIFSLLHLLVFALVSAYHDHMMLINCGQTLCYILWYL